MLLVVAPVWIETNVALYRIVHWGSYVLLTLVLLRSLRLYLRELVIFVVGILGVALFGHYFQHGMFRGLDAIVVLPLVMAMGWGYREILGTLAPGRYRGYLARDQQLIWAFEAAMDHLGAAFRSTTDRGFESHLKAAIVRGNVVTKDPGWLDVRSRFLALAWYAHTEDRKLEEYERLGHLYASTFVKVRDTKRVCFGRFGRPTKPAELNPAT